MGFRQALKYVLDVFCFAYYVKANNLISDTAFDELEKVWKVLFREETAPMRAVERDFLYSVGVQVIYDEIVRAKKGNYSEVKQETDRPVLYKGKELESYSKKRLVELIKELHKKNVKMFKHIKGTKNDK